MKVYQFIVLLVLVAYINSSCLLTAPRSENDCFNARLSANEKISGGGYCCYIHFTGQSLVDKISLCKVYPKDYTEDKLKKNFEVLKKKGFDKISCRFDK